MSDRIKCADYIHDALVRETVHRKDYPGAEWVEAERVAVTLAANQWALAHGYGTTVSVDDVERVEQQAVGHIDYARKLALYVAELVVSPSEE